MKGTFYYITGYGRSGDTTVNEAYNPLNDTWTTKASLPSFPRSETVAVSDGTFVYLIGGRPVSLVGHDLWRYSPTNNNWTSLTPMPTSRATEHMAVYSNGNIYVVGGRTTDAPTDGGDLAILEIYNVASNTWTTGSPLPSPLADGHAVLQNGKIYVFGGFTTTGTASTNTYIYDISSGVWLTGSSSPVGVIDPAAGVCGPQIYLIGGSTAQLGLQNSNYAYNPLTDTWNSSLSIPTPTAEVEAISYKGQIFVVSGGIFGSGGFNPANQIFHCADNMLYVSPGQQPVQPAGSMIAYKIKVSNTQPFTSWDIMVRTNQSVINPQTVSISGNLFQANFSSTLTEQANCVNGAGTGCTGSDGPGVIHSAAIVTSPAPNATLSGILFTVTYKAVGGTFSPVAIFNDNLGRGACCPVSHFSVDGIYGRPPPNFGIIATPSQSVIGQHSTGLVSIAIVSLNNFTGKVSLSGTVAPSGLTLTFNPAIVSVNNKTSVSQLTISTTGTTAIGNYTITVTGQSGTLTHTTHIHVAIVPDFSMIVTPNSFVTREGTILSSRIILASQGFSGPVVLSTSIIPSLTNGPATTFNTTFVFLSQNASQTVQLLIGAFSNTAPGNYTITVTATSLFPTTLSHSANVSLDVLAPMLTLTPSSGIPGATITVRGSNFPGLFFFQGQSSVTVSFDDMFLGTVPVNNGSFTFVLNVPIAQPGTHFIKAEDFNTLGQANATFTVLPTPTALTVSIDSGTIYFPGDTAVVSVLVTQTGTLVDTTGVQLTVQLILPNGTMIVLGTTHSPAGFFVAKYSIPSTGPLGVYAIKATAHSSNGSTGTVLGSFEVRRTWLSSQANTITGAAVTVGVIGLAAVTWRKGYLGKKKENPATGF